MINIFNILFYCLYRIFKLTKRVDVKDEDLTSSFFSILLSTNTLMVLFTLSHIFKFFLSNSIRDVVIVKIILGAIFFMWYYICKRYFKKYSNRIINQFEIKYSNKNKEMVFIGIFYTLITFSSFIGLALFFSR